MDPERLYAATEVSPQEAPNPRLKNLTEEFKNRTNAAFLASVRRRLDAAKGKSRGNRGLASIVLVGGRGYGAQILRAVQRHIRREHDPSHWSHAFLLPEPLPRDDDGIRSARSAPIVWESTPFPREEEQELQLMRGMSRRPLSEYASARTGGPSGLGFPNIAVLSIAMTAREAAAVVSRAAEAPACDLGLERLLGTWLHYLAHRGLRANPLLDGHAMPCAAMLQHAYTAIDFDLAPGAFSANLCLEHLWQSAKWFSDLCERRGRTVSGFYCARDRSGGVPPEDHEPARRFEIPVEGKSGPAPDPFRAHDVDGREVPKFHGGLVRMR